MKPDKKYEMLLNVIDKAESGPIIDESVWDKEYIGENTRSLIDKYDLTWKLDDQNYVSQDDGLVDRTFEAGMELAREVGVYCVDTNRQITEPRGVRSKVCWTCDLVYDQ